MCGDACTHAYKTVGSLAYVSPFSGRKVGYKKTNGQTDLFFSSWN
jgi:hypothetical protein